MYQFNFISQQGIKNSFRIKCIQVHDNLTNNTGGYATITAGGVNHNSTTIVLKSQPGGDLNNRIVIYTFKENGPHSQQQPPLVSSPTQQHPAFGWNVQNPPKQPQYAWPPNTNHVPGRSFWSKK